MAETTVPFPRRSKATGAASTKPDNGDARADAPKPLPPTRGGQPVSGYAGMATNGPAPVIVNPEAAADDIAEWAMTHLYYVNLLGDVISSSDHHFEDDAKGAITALVHLNKQAEEVVCAAIRAVQAERADLRTKLKERADG